MDNKVTYQQIYPADYEVLTKIMTSAFDEDTAMHTDLKEDGPNGYNDGRLIKKLNENVNFESYKIVYEENIVGAYTIERKQEKEYILEMLFIDPAYRAKHLGITVWKDIEQKFTDAKKWTLETPSYSKRNHHFYTNKCGFHFLEEHRFDNGGTSFIFEKVM